MLDWRSASVPRRRFSSASRLASMARLRCSRISSALTRKASWRAGRTRFH